MFTALYCSDFNDIISHGVFLLSAPPNPPDPTHRRVTYFR